MTITSTELRSFTAQGAQTAMQATYASVKAALAGAPSLAGLEYDVFLQGSYANDTNTRGDSDVDIVLMLTTSYIPDTARLSSEERSAYEASRIPATVTAQSFRDRVEQALVAYYGRGRVQPKNKCLRIPKNPGYVDADVVPALQHRLYTSYPAYSDPKFIEGIAITPLSGSRIVNYPKEHIANGQTKNGVCSQNYKPTVRQVKRLRRKAVDQRLLSPSAAPGYLLECMVSNVPTATFTSDEVDRVISVVAWLNAHSAANLAEGIWSGDRIHRLFVDDPGHHDPHNAKHVLETLWSIL